MSAPPSMSILTQPAHPPAAAIMSGVMLSLLAQSTEAPDCKRSLIISCRPSRDAQCKAVFCMSPALESTIAPCLSAEATASKSPSIAPLMSFSSNVFLAPGPFGDALVAPAAAAEDGVAANGDGFVGATGGVVAGGGLLGLAANGLNGPPPIAIPPAVPPPPNAVALPKEKPPAEEDDGAGNLAFETGKLPGGRGGGAVSSSSSSAPLPAKGFGLLSPSSSLSSSSSLSPAGMPRGTPPVGLRKRPPAGGAGPPLAVGRGAKESGCEVVAAADPKPLPPLAATAPKPPPPLAATEPNEKPPAGLAPPL